MRKRPASRLLVINPEGRVLLFRFTHHEGPLAGKDYWATPGGGLEAGESFEDAAIRELKEETGIQVAHPGAQVGQRAFTLQLADGELVYADERYFVVRTDMALVRREGWSKSESEVMTDHRWWSIHELKSTSETIWPERLAELLSGPTS